MGEQRLDHALAVVGALERGGSEVDALEEEVAQRVCRLERRAVEHDSRAAVVRQLELRRVPRGLDAARDQPVEAQRVAVAERAAHLVGEVGLADQACADRVVDIVIEVRDRVGQLDDLALERVRRAPGLRSH